MKRITVPEPEIELYKDGFQGHDKLGRQETGRKLSELVERIDEPLVIALDGAWGSGKSFFLKCWVGHHLQQEAHKAETVYFDAFKHDYLDEPLIALTGEIIRRFEGQPKQAVTELETKDARPSGLGKLKKAGMFAGKSSGKIFTSMAANYAKKALGEETFEELGKEFKHAIDAGIDTAEAEAQTLLDADWGNDAAEEFWEAERAKVDAMEGFRLALQALTEPVTKKQAAESEGRLKKGDPTRKLVIVVDELDRCRPDYALSLLEIIKHFFNVPGLHFVLGVNLAELQNSVKARYGGNADAGRYLSKFYHVRMPLTLAWRKRSKSGDATSYFEFVRDEINLDEKHYAHAFGDYINLCNLSGSISLRDIERIATKAAVTPIMSEEQNIRDRYLVAGLIVVSVVRPDWIKQISAGTLRFEQLQTVYPLESIDFDSDYGDDLRQLWRWALGLVPRDDLEGNDLIHYGRIPSNPVEHMSTLIKTYLDAFRLN